MASDDAAVGKRIDDLDVFQMWCDRRHDRTIRTADALSLRASKQKNLLAVLRLPGHCLAACGCGRVSRKMGVTDC
jgi:hypothetical protein